MSAANRIDGIQWMRALAAWMVVVDHSLLTLIDKAGASSDMAPMAVLLGQTAVQQFFIISGLAMLVSSTNTFGPGASADFLKRRFVRIVPLYWLTSLVYVAKLSLTGQAPAWEDVLRSLLFVPYLNAQGEMQPVYGLGWTLNYEMFFYGLFALGLLGSVRTTWAVVAGSLGVLVALGAGWDAPGPTQGSQWLYFVSRPIVLFFLAGMGLAWALRRLAGGGAVPRLGFTLSVAVSALMIGFFVASDAMRSLPWVAQIAWLCLPMWVMCVAPVRGRFDQALAAVARHCGDACYSIYLTHAFVLGPAGRLYAKWGLSSPLLFTAFTLAVCTLLGLLCYRFVEKPLLRGLSPQRSSPSQKLVQA